MEIDFSRPKQLCDVSTLGNVGPVVPIDTTQPSEDDMQMFFQKMATNSKSVALLSAVPEFSDKFVSIPASEPNVPKCLGDLYSDCNRDLTHEELTELCEHVADELVVTRSEALYLEVVTRKQSASLEWFDHRVGRITASTVYDVLHTNQDQPSISLVKRLCSSEHKKVSTAPLEWGRTNEDTARSGYCREQKIRHTQFLCTPAGLVVNPNYPYLGATPDGWVDCECCGRGTVEIKCPYTYRSTDPNTINDSTFYLQRFSDQLKLDPKHKYYYQVQMQLSICEVNYCDFVVWTLAGMATIRIHRDEAFFNTVQPTLHAFFRNCILPELLTRKVQNPVVGTGSSNVAASNSSLYCYCQQPEDDQRMIGCDNDTCTYKWFHFKCLGLKRKPRGKYWYCPECRK